ncbi:DUF4202 domain-containing protein [Flagellimonas pacifica]|uniref:DUF4202 domain-containing protein n=1 Tax=Flagellimonas pacifica TaxID=1247520 RepID=A0A285ME58_9FLAO|nr:DUF4202 domain-containing protein [Allomuricauda parva]SNY95450.1 protein of unknown function [Allomuricauda parva]
MQRAFLNNFEQTLAMAISQKQTDAFQLFDAANSADPNLEFYGEREFPKELLYAIRMTETLQEYEPEASEALQLAARCQHICRWEIPRQDYESNRAGYLKWRQDLKNFHAQKAEGLLRQAGYEQDVLDKVEFLLLKKQLKKSEDTQALEDVACLVFLQYYFEPFIKKHAEEKVVEILQKTWRKMSSKGQQRALELSISEKGMELITKAIADGTE